jgi:hypothetical protein
MNLPYLRKRLVVLTVVCVCALTLMFSFRTHADDEAVWRPITRAELAMKAPQVDPDADAEAIFWDTTLDDKKVGKLTYRHYVRVKIFTERGRDRFAKMDIRFTKGRKIDNVAARVIKPDGTIVDLKPEDIFDREIAAAGKIRIQAKSFAIPGIEPGVIVEYQYSEMIKGDSAAYERLEFQRDIPMQKVTYSVRPYSGASLGFETYNMPQVRWNKEKDGYFTYTMTNVPAYKEEPYMPPADEVRKWVYLYYRTWAGAFQWSFLSMTWDEILKKLSKPNKEVKQKAAELTAGAHSDEDKVRRIYDFVQKHIKNFAYDKTLTEEQIEKMDVKDGDDALRRGMGGSVSIDMLFASLTKAAGLPTNIVLAPDRSENFFSQGKYPFPNFVQWSAIAVQVDGQWKYFDPCAPFLPAGTLAWNREDTTAMVIGDGGHSWMKIPMSDVKVSAAKRTGKFTLDTEGNLAGTVSLEYNGQQAISRRRDEFRDSDSKREDSIKDEFKTRISTAEFTDMRIENFDDSTKPLIYTFKVRVPNYAQKVGKRLILQPGFFEYGASPVFSAASRTYDIYFPYPWSEQDSVEITLPKGMDLDSADAPAEVFDGKRIGDDKITMGVDKKTNTLVYNRSFHFGGGGYVLFPAAAYPVIKQMFDGFYKADTHAISLKQAANQ